MHLGEFSISKAFGSARKGGEREEEKGRTLLAFATQLSSFVVPFSLLSLSVFFSLVQIHSMASGPFPLLVSGSPREITATAGRGRTVRVFSFLLLSCSSSLSLFLSRLTPLLTLKNKLKNSSDSTHRRPLPARGRLRPRRKEAWSGTGILRRLGPPRAEGEKGGSGGGGRRRSRVLRRQSRGRGRGRECGPAPRRPRVLAADDGNKLWLWRPRGAARRRARRRRGRRGRASGDERAREESACFVKKEKEKEEKPQSEKKKGKKKRTARSKSRERHRFLLFVSPCHALSAFFSASAVPLT